MIVISWNFGGSVMARACDAKQANELIYELNMNRVPFAATNKHGQTLATTKG